MSIYCLNDVMRHAEATGGARLVLFVLAEHADDDGTETYPAVETIGQKARLSRRGVQGGLRKLEEIGEIERDGFGPKGTTKWKITPKAMGGADASPPADRDVVGRTSTPGGGAGRAPEPSGEPSENHKRNARASADEVPDDFPDDLRPHARAVMRILLDVAQRHGAKAVHARSVGLVLMARPRKPMVRAAHDFAAHFDGGTRQLRDVVSAYRNWLDREEDLAAVEYLPGMGPAPRPGNVTALRPNASESERRRARQEERLRRAGAVPPDSPPALEPGPQSDYGALS